MQPEQWAELHDGLLTNHVAAEHGIGRGQLARRRASGRYRVVRRGVVAIAGAPPTWHQQVRAVVLTCNAGVRASHLTAARLLDAEVDDDGHIHVTGPMGRAVRLEGVIGHRSGTLERADRSSRRGIPCTSALRTIIDLSGMLSLRTLGKLLDDFLRRRLLRLEALRERVGRLRPAPGRSVRTLRTLLEQRIPGYDPGESALEARIARIIDRAAFPRPVQQHRVDLGGARYRIDFSWPEHHLYLEGNGFGWHQLASELDSDAVRQNELVLSGWTPIEITWRMSDATIERTIRRFLTLVRALPHA